MKEVREVQQVGVPLAMARASFLAVDVGALFRGASSGRSLSGDR